MAKGKTIEVGQDYCDTLTFRSCCESSDGFKSLLSLAETFLRLQMVLYCASCNDQVYPEGEDVVELLDTDLGIVDGTGAAFQVEQLNDPIAVTTFAADTITAPLLGTLVSVGNYIDVAGGASNGGRYRVVEILNDNTVRVFGTLTAGAGAGETAEPKQLGVVLFEINRDRIIEIGEGCYKIAVWAYDLNGKRSRIARFGVDFVG